MPTSFNNHKPLVFASGALAVLCAGFLALSAGADADAGGAKKHKLAAGQIAAGARFSCAIASGGAVRCWGIGDAGALGQGNTEDIGDDETPNAVPSIDLGAGVKAKAISAGFYHACAIDQTSRLHCWGDGYDGQLGYGNDDSIGDDETPAGAGVLDLGGHKVKTISAGGFHTCAILDNGKLRCWGEAADGQLGYAATSTENDAGVVGNVNLGKNRTVKAVAAGGFHTCAILDNDKVRCWGRGVSGQLGYGNKKDYGDNEKVSKAPKLRLGKNQKAVAISAYGQHTCAILKKRDKVLCWGTGKYGQLGYKNTKSIGDNEDPGSVGPVSIGGKAYAIQTGGRHTCATLSTGQVRCWGLNSNGQLGYGNKKSIGDNEKPSKAGPVKLGGKVS